MFSAHCNRLGFDIRATLPAMQFDKELLPPVPDEIADSVSVIAKLSRVASAFAENFAKVPTRGWY